MALFATGQLEEARAALAEAERAAATDAERALLLCRLGDVVHEQGEHSAASELHLRSLALAEVRGDDGLAGLCHAGLGTTAHVRGDLRRARAHYEKALLLLRRARHVRGEARTLSRIGFLAVDEGRTTEARERFEVSLALFRALADDRLLGYATGYLGNALRAEGALDDAIARYGEAIDAMRSVGDRLFEGVFCMDRGIAMLLAERLEPALHELDAARSIMGEVKNTYAEGLVLGYRACALARAGLVDRAIAAEAEARAVCTGVPLDCLELHARHVWIERGDRLDELASWLDAEDARPAANEHVRLARRLLRRAMERARPPASVLVFERRARRVRAPNTDYVDLAPYETLARIVEALLDAHARHPGAPQDSRTLLRAGWPDERVTREAGAIRVRVAIAQLRKLGLRDVLLHRQGGYLFDPNIRVVETN
jgi:tetratricopeptide (TPR) repeat protein